MSSSVMLLIYALIQCLTATPGIYFSSEGCGAPRLDREYMGGKNLEGNNLELLIDGQPLAEFNKNGFEFGREYEMVLNTKDEDWMQYVTHMSHGTTASNIGMMECDGKVLLFAMDFNLAEFTWTAPTQQQIENNDDVLLTTSYAPAYTQAYIQAFNIKSKAQTEAHADL